MKTFLIMSAVIMLEIAGLAVWVNYTIDQRVQESPKDPLGYHQFESPKSPSAFLDSALSASTGTNPDFQSGGQQLLNSPAR